MKTALDTNVLSTIWSREPLEPAVRAALNHAKRDGHLLLSPFVYAEGLAHPSYSLAGIDHFLSITGITVDLSVLEAVWAEAGRRFSLHAARRRQTFGEQPRRILADFLIGAHALLQADRLMTLDIRYYRQYFPELQLYPLGE